MVLNKLIRILAAYEKIKEHLLEGGGDISYLHNIIKETENDEDLQSSR